MPFWLLIVFIFHSYWLCTSLLALANETMSSTYIKAVFANITHCTQLIILKYLYKVNLNKQTNNVWLNPIKPDFLKSYCFHTKCILNKRTWKCYFSKRITMSRTVALGVTVDPCSFIQNTFFGSTNVSVLVLWTACALLTVWTFLQRRQKRRVYDYGERLSFSFPLFSFFFF